MKLKPRQIIGLFAIVVFGGIMIFRFTQPSEKQIMEQRLANLPSFTAPEPQLPALNLSTPTVPAVPDLSSLPPSSAPTGPIYIYEGAPDYFNLGSQAAKDDLYCAGVLAAEFEETKGAIDPNRMSLLLRDQVALDDAGLAKLRAEGVAKEGADAGFTLAYADKAKTDYAAKTLRIPVEVCSQRAAALN